MNLSKRQKEVLDFVKSYTDSHGCAPSIEEVRQHFGISSSAAVQKHLKGLEKKRAIKRRRHGQRATRDVLEDLPQEEGARQQIEGGLTNGLLAFEADHVWVSENLETLLERYADQWIAVKDRRVVASSPDFSGLLQRLPDPAHTCVEFITRERLEMVL